MPLHSEISDEFLHPLKGFEDAVPDTMPIKNDLGQYEWIKADRRLHSDVSTSLNVGIVLELMRTFTIPADTLTSLGEQIKILAWGSYQGVSPSNKQIDLVFGGTNIAVNTASIAALVTEGWKLEADIFMGGIGLNRSISVFDVDGFNPDVKLELTDKDETAAIVVDLNFTCNAPGACSVDGFIIYKLGGMIQTLLP